MDVCIYVRVCIKYVYVSTLLLSLLPCCPLTAQLLMISVNPDYRNNAVGNVAVYQYVTLLNTAGSWWRVKLYDLFYKCKIFVTRFAVSCSCNGCESCCIYIAVMSVQCADVRMFGYHRYKKKFYTKSSLRFKHYAVLHRVVMVNT